MWFKFEVLRESIRSFSSVSLTLMRVHPLSLITKRSRLIFFKHPHTTRAKKNAALTSFEDENRGLDVIYYRTLITA